MGDIEAALGREKLFVVGRIGELVAGERAYLEKLGDPRQPFFVDAARFPANVPWPPSLRVNEKEQSPRLADYMDAFVYLGPEPDRDMTGTIPLTSAQKRELDRRNAINGDGQRAMRARYAGRARWFSAHPDDVPARPR